MSAQPSHQPSDSPSDDEQANGSPDAASNRKRSSRACDQCRKTKSKCERDDGDNELCRSCAAAGVSCTYLGPSYKRGPPKGYIHAIEQRWHQVESILGAILSSSNPAVQSLVQNLKKDQLANDILSRVDSGPFGPSGRQTHSVNVTKEDFFASILNSAPKASRDSSRPRRQSRVSREIVSSNNSMLVSPTLEWQDQLSSRYAIVDRTTSDSYAATSGHVQNASPFGPYSASASQFNDGPPPQRRRLDSTNGPPQPDWDRMYTLEHASDNENGDDLEENSSMVGQLSLDENKQVRFHGLASGLNLLYHNERTDERKASGIWTIPMARIWPPAQNQFIPEESFSVEMPPIEVQRHLLDLYFTYVHPVYPVVHKTMFRREFEAANSYPDIAIENSSDKSTPNKHHISKLLLLSMFAVAARYSEEEAPPSSDQMWEAGLFYMVQARELLNRIYHYSRPSTCQALLLLGLREISLGSSEHGWLYVGMAVRMAYDLGLHRDSTQWKIGNHPLFTPEEQQARRQLWWACNRADKYTAVWMGRPSLIPAMNHDTPLPDIDCDELWQPHPIDPAATEFPPVPGRIMATFRASSQLANIAGDIIENIYPIHPTSHSTKKAALAKLEARLDKFYAELPEELAYDTSSKRYVPPPHILQLHMTYWNMVMLLHRAFIPKKPTGRDAKQGKSHQDAAALKSFDICQSAASKITAIVCVYQKQFSLRRGALMITQHMFAAGIMHVVTLTLRPSNVQASISLSHTLNALKEMEVIWPSAKRSWDLLNGAKIHVDSGLLSFYASGGATSSAGLGQPGGTGTDGRNKRSADDAFSRENSMLRQEAYNELTKRPHVVLPDGHEPTPTHTVLAQMLGIALPGVEPSTSYLPEYAWWPRQGEGNAADSNKANGTQHNNNSATSTPSLRLRAGPGMPTRHASGDFGAGSASSSVAHSTPTLPLSTPSPRSSIDASSPASGSMPIPFTFDQTGYWMGAMMAAPENVFGMDFATNVPTH